MLGLSLSLTLSSQYYGDTPTPTPSSTITALTIQDATVLPDGTDAAIPNGWVAKATMPYDGAATFDPTKVVLTVTDPGFNSDGTAATRTRTIRGGTILRKQYPNNTTLMAAQVGANLEVYFSLQDPIYSGSTVTAVAAEAGYYGAADAGSVAGVVNSSTRAYPKPLFAWLNIQGERATGSGFSVEAVAYHRHAMNGQQVACIEFAAKDAQGVPNVSAVQRAGTPALSDFQTKGQRVEAYKASIPLSALTQGDTCKLSAVVKPWIGTAWDLESEGIAWPTAQPQTLLRFVCDKAAIYGDAIAYVKAGASGGVVSFDGPTARATPYPSVNTALAALVTFNTANRSRANHSGSTIYLMDDGAGGPVAHSQTGTSAAVAYGDCWTDIRVDPLATGAVTFATSLTTANRNFAPMLRWFVDLQANSQGVIDSSNANASLMQAFEGLTATYTGSVAAAFVTRFGCTYLRNVTIAGVAVTGHNPFAGSGTTRSQVALGLGVVMPSTAVNLGIKAFAVIGCDFGRTTLGDNDPATVPNFDPQDGMVIANNRFRNMQAASIIGVKQSFTRGVAVVQNVFERAVVGSTAAFLISGDGAPTAVANAVCHANTVVGERTNLEYSDDANMVGVQKRGSFRGNLLQQYNVKTDDHTDTTTVTGRTGNWELVHSVGSIGNVSLTGSAAGVAPASTGSWLGRFWPDAGYNVGAANVGFVDDKSGATGAGLGNYQPTGPTNAAFDRMPAGLAVLKLDLAGNARLNDGAGAAGAYERPAA